MKAKIVVTLLLSVVAVVVVSACSSSSNGTKKTPARTTAQSPSSTSQSSGSSQSEVAVTLVEYRIAPTPASVPAGNIKFNARNIGATTHELHVIKTDLQPNALPTKADGSVDEGAAELTMIDHVTDIASGTQKSLAVDLQPGHYVLFCNILQTTNGQTVSHYAQGMATDFTVTQ